MSTLKKHGDTTALNVGRPPQDASLRDAYVRPAPPQSGRVESLPENRTTAARSGDIRGATWDEIDLMGKLWSIPANRMKRPRPHLIPLSDAAVAVFQKALELRTGEEPLCFPGIVRTRATATQPAMAKPLSDASLKAVLVRMGRTALPHGFRSTFKDWVSEVARYPNELSEAALAHAIKDKTEAAYRRGDLLERRREMMDAWATWCEAKSVENVVSISTARKKWHRPLHPHPPQFTHCRRRMPRKQPCSVTFPKASSLRATCGPTTQAKPELPPTWDE
ncbi:tyrosine-type recombinase/integrase [Sandarakinorhabdus rubra]|uniref:tyrosine-type recombinase/integrase n=1 Tax=Sandarakinorhabdus rubra TaxID=2672568 RepID=UPI00196A1CB9|nr:site-specific integrase [Sandarakinorhabdus rubra]